MADKIIENNQVSITGKIDTGFTFSHQVFGEGFISVSLDEGEHEICLKYETPGFRMGLGISLISIAVFAILMYAKSRRSF